MSGTLLAASLVALLGAAAVALAASRWPRTASAIALAGAVAGGSCVLAAAVPILLGTPAADVELPFRFAAERVVLGVDSLSALFLVLIGILGNPAAVFGLGYLSGHGSWRAATTTAAAARAHAGICLLLASLILVVTARNGLVFLVAWEAMTIAAYLLVVYDHQSEDVRAAGFHYLVASHLAYACLLSFFAVLGHEAGSLGFAEMTAAGAHLTLPAATALFVLAVVGFGTKAGIVPFHVWLPRAHPAAPSHVSALMSGVLIKTGVYGLLRALQFLGPARVGFGIALVIVGAATALYGIAFSIAQRDLKRALAYSSVENIGLIVLGLGLAQMAAALLEPRVALLAAAGALVHTLHHTLMKGGLFLGAGAVVHAAGTRDLERLGGLMRTMPRTAAAFLACAASIAALPPFCEFVGEWLLLSAAVLAAARFPVAHAVVAILAVLAIVLAGALSAAGFARLVAVIFLGTPRSREAREARAGTSLLIVPPLVLAALCLLCGLFPRAVVALVERAAAAVAGVPVASAEAAVHPALAYLASIGLCGLLLIALILVLVLVRRAVVRAPAAPDVPTWGCGFAGREARLQYTASSFAKPLVETLSGVLAPETPVQRAEGPFPASIAAETLVPDRIDARIFDPFFRAAAQRMAVVRRFQDGRLTRYLMFLVGALVGGLGWVVASRWVLGR